MTGYEQSPRYGLILLHTYLGLPLNAAVWPLQGPTLALKLWI
jgi:hypothetical protein